MRLRNIPGADEVISNSPYCIQNPAEFRGKWHEFLGNKNPIHIEIGMGKGRFLMQLAEQNPDINYIGIERYTSVLLRAVQKTEELPLSNIHFLCIDAATLPEIFAENEISKIYLNFSDPWPKDRHSKRRLTSSTFLEKYDFSGKKIILFATSGGSGFGNTVKELQPSAPNSEIVEGKLLNRATKQEIADWIKEI